MKILRFSLLTCLVLGISAMFVDSANAGFSFKNGSTDGSIVDRNSLWATKAGGAVHLTTEAEWDAALAAVTAGVDVELGLYYIVDSLRSDGSEYYSLASDGELTGVVWGLAATSLTKSTIPAGTFYTIELSAAQTGAQFRAFFEDGPDPVATPFEGFADPVLNRDALTSGLQPFDSSGAVESGPPALLDGEIVGDNLADGKFIVLTVQVLDSAGGLIDGISASSTVFADVHGDAGGLDGTADKFILADGEGTAGSGRDIRLNTRFFFNGTSPSDVAGFGDAAGQNVTGVSTDPFSFTVIPEPSSFALFGIGAPFLIGMALRRRKKNKLAA